MNGYQLIVSFFGLLSLAAAIWAIWCVAKAKLRYKPAWILGCLFGFVGVGLNWTMPDELFLLFGVQIPPVMVFKMLPTGAVIVKVQFPLVALVALAKSEFGEAGRYSDAA